MKCFHDRRFISREVVKQSKRPDLTQGLAIGRKMSQYQRTALMSSEFIQDSDYAIMRTWNRALGKLSFHSGKLDECPLKRDRDLIK